MERRFSWLNPKLEARDTSHMGRGLFASADIAKDELLVVMGGYIFDVKDENTLNPFNEDKPIEIAEDFSFSPVSKNDMDRMPQHYINHSCEPNTGFKGQLFMVAMKDIRKDEEIFYDYAMITHSNPKSTGFFKMNCLCGTPSCRKIVQEDDWRMPELQKKYAGYFQWYIQEKINGNLKKPYILPENF